MCALNRTIVPKLFCLQNRLFMRYFCLLKMFLPRFFEKKTGQVKFYFAQLCGFSGGFSALF